MLSIPSQREAANAIEVISHKTLSTRLSWTGFALCIFAFWMLQHPYEGLVHDSVLYSFQALAHLHPESLGHDVFLSHGSQDQFTLFSPMAAYVIKTLDLERGAAVITLAAQVGFYASAWLLARRFMRASLAALAVGLLVTLPSVYGALHLFSYSEPFMTPRVPAEALVLVCVAAVFVKRHLVAALCMTAALLLHPLMAVAGLVFLAVRFGALRRPQMAMGLGVVAFALLVAIARYAPMGRVARFDPAWFGIVHSGFSYLFPSSWPLADLDHMAVPMATLLIGSITLGDVDHRLVCKAALITGLCGLGLTYVGSDLLHIVGVAQVQPWRWLWLTNALAVMLLPVIGTEQWAKGIAGRAALLLLVAAWVCIDERFVPIIAALSVAAAVGAPRITDARRARLMLGGATIVLTLGILVFISTTISVLGKLTQISPDTTLYHSDFLLILRQLRPWAAGGVLTSAALLSAWWAVTRPNVRRAAIAVPIVGIALCAAFAPLTWASWSQVQFPPRVHDQFAQWRRYIAPQETVLWGGKPLVLWYLLERPSYWSFTQSAGLVFSREMAMEMTRRQQTLLQQESKLDPKQDLTETCGKNSGLGFVISPVDLGPTPFPRVSVDPVHPADGQLWLYRCWNYRG